jgi:hypothetical protein
VRSLTAEVDQVCAHDYVPSGREGATSPPRSLGAGDRLGFGHRSDTLGLGGGCGRFGIISSDSVQDTNRTTEESQ